MGESQGRHDDDEAGRLADDQAGLSYPDKRDCGVSQRAKENDHEFHEFTRIMAKDKDDLKVISLDASTVRVPVEPLGAVTDDELNKRIHELFVKYCCGGIDKPEDEMPHYVKVCREVFTNGYKAGYQDMLRNVTGKEWEK